MSEHTLPILIINLIGELSYILQNRFKAYGIPFEKTYDFMEELYTEIFDPNNIIRYKFPQVLPSHLKPIRDSLNQLLKSLSFKILGGGFDKLFNMMIMSLKYHFVNCKESRDILNLTSIHLESMIKYVQNPYTGCQLKQLKQRIIQEYTNLPNFYFFIIRQDILKLISGKKRKIRILMNLNRQDSSGNVYKHNKFILLNKDQIKHGENEFDNEFLRNAISEKKVINYRYYNKHGDVITKNNDICKDIVINPFIMTFEYKINIFDYPEIPNKINIFNQNNDSNITSINNNNNDTSSSSRLAINLLDELRDLINPSTTNLVNKKSKSSLIKQNRDENDEWNSIHDHLIQNSNNIELLNNDSLNNNNNNNEFYKKRAHSVSIDIHSFYNDIKEKNDSHNTSENELLSSPLYKRRVESLNNVINSYSNDKNSFNTSLKERNSIPSLNISIKDLKSKFESNTSLLHDSVSYKENAKTEYIEEGNKSGTSHVNHSFSSNTNIKIVANEKISKIEEEDEEDNEDDEKDEDNDKIENSNNEIWKNKDKNSYNISISNNLNFLKNHDILNENQSSNNYKLNSRNEIGKRCHLQNNFAFDNEKTINDIFSISTSIHSINHGNKERESNNSLSESQKVKISTPIKKLNSLKQGLFDPVASNNDIKNNIINNIFNTSPKKYHSSMNIESISNKESAVDSSSTVVLSNRSAKQKEITNLLETSKNTFNKTSENNDLDFLELMDG